MKIFILSKHNGFSLLEVTVTLIIISILLSAAIPVMSRSYLEKAAQKTALDMSSIEDAARKFYIDTGNWPSNISALEGNYLPSSVVWNDMNPFAYSSATPSNYVYSISPNGSTLTVSTSAPADAQPIIQNLLPLTTISGSIISSVISVPGSAGSMPSGAIVMWSGPVSSIPSGWVLCDGSNGTPDLRDQFVVGARQDNNGVAMTNVTGSLTQSGNGQLPYTADAINTVTTTDSLCHLKGLVYTGSACYVAPNSPTSTNGFGTGSVNVAVYYALAFIMKT